MRTALQSLADSERALDSNRERGVRPGSASSVIQRRSVVAYHHPASPRHSNAATPWSTTWTVEGHTP